MASKILRLTMFKIANPDDQEAALAAYKKLSIDNKKDGKAYILSCDAYKLHDDPRGQGFTILAKTTFENLDDMKYYDAECEAHKALKGVVGPKQQGMMMVYADV